MTDFTRQTLLSLVGISLCLLPALLILPRLRIRAGARRIIWIFFALRLLLPFALPVPGAPAIHLSAPKSASTALPEPQKSAAPQTIPPIQTANPDTQPNPTPAVTPPAPQNAASTATPALQPGTWLPLLWAAGVFFLAVWRILGHLVTRRRLFEDSTACEDEELIKLLRHVQDEIGLRRKLPVRILSRPASPMVLGLLRPILFLPEAVTERDALRLILRHELSHLQRHDPAVKCLLLLTETLYWVHPLVWWLRRQAELDLEFACDEAVLTHQEPHIRKAYAAAIAASIERQLVRTPALSTKFQGGWKAMKHRLNLILNTPPLRSGRTAAALFMALLLFSGLFAGCIQEAPQYAEYADLPGGEYLELIGRSGKEVKKELKINENEWSYVLEDDGEFAPLVDRIAPETLLGEDYEMQLYFTRTAMDAPTHLDHYRFIFHYDSTDYKEKRDRIAELYSDFCGLLGEPTPYRNLPSIADCLETTFDAQPYTSTWVLAENISFPGAEEDHNMLLLCELQVGLSPEQLSVYITYKPREAGYSNLAGYRVRDFRTGELRWQPGDPGVPAEYFKAYLFSPDYLSYLGKTPAAAADLLKASGEAWEKELDKNGNSGRYIRTDLQPVFLDLPYTLSLLQDGSMVYSICFETTVASMEDTEKQEAIRKIHELCTAAVPSTCSRTGSTPVSQGLEENFSAGTYETWWLMARHIIPESNLDQTMILTCCLRVEYTANEAKITASYQIEDYDAINDFPDFIS